MQTRRQISLALLALPFTGCAYRPLADLHTESASMPAQAPAWRTPSMGQRWTYLRYNTFNGELLATEDHEITTIEPEIVIRHRNRSSDSATRVERQLPGGRMLHDLAWDSPQTYEPALPLWPTDLSPGARSAFRGSYRIDGFSYQYWITQHTRVHGWEYVRVPAGRMLTLRVEHYLKLAHRDISRYDTTRHDTLWLAPEIGRWVARETSGEYLVPSDPGAFRGLEESHRWELQSWA